jgi:hypothetical protein
MSEPVSARRAAAECGYGNSRAAVRRFKRLVENRERHLCITLTAKRSGEHPRYNVELCREHIPELRQSRVEILARRLPDLVREIKDRVTEDAANAACERMEPRLRELWERDEQIAEFTERLDVRVQQLSSEISGIRLSRLPPTESTKTDQN